MTALKNHLLEIKSYLTQFIRHPLEGMKKLPGWNWKTLLLCQILVTMISGALSGLLQMHFTNIIIGLFSAPILTLMTVFISSLFFYYTFQIFVGKLLSFRAVFEVVFFANIPFFIFFILNTYFPPIIPIGLGFTSLLLIVGFVENLQIPKKFITRLVAGIYVLMLMTYILTWWKNFQIEENRKSQSYQVPEVKLGE